MKQSSRLLSKLCLLLFLALFHPIPAQSQPLESDTSNPHFITKTITVNGGVELEQAIINGPPNPPAGTELERMPVSLSETDKAGAVQILTVPALDWFFGCSATSGAMIAGFYDRTGYPNVYTGITRGGVMPLDNSPWSNWTDGCGDTYAQCPLTASRNGLDGRTARGSIDNYWICYGSSSDDPYITSGRAEHAWGDAIGDFMKTSQSIFQNVDGATTFYNYRTSDRLTCSSMESYGISNKDGTYGRKRFYEARGYLVADCYSQLADNAIGGGFSFADLMVEIDAGRPVMLNLEGHTVVGVGYDRMNNTVYLHDTWDNKLHTMTWGGSYSGIPLYAVSIVNLEDVLPDGTKAVPVIIDLILTE